MKTASFVSPAIVLVIAGAWIVSQHQTIHALDRQSDLLQAAIMERHQTASVSTEPQAPVKSPAASQSGNSRRIDWAQLVAKMEDSDFNGLDMMMFDQQMSTMSQEELLGAMDEIGRLAIPDNLRRRLEEMILFPFSRKFPEFAVIHLTARQLDGGIGGEYLAQAMETWAGKDPEKAFAWMDQQIAAGLFESKYLDGKNWTRILYEGVLIRSLLTAEGDRLSQWFDRLPADLHKDVLEATVSVWRPHGVFGAAEEVALAGLVRAKLSPEDQSGVFVRRANEACAGGLDAVDKFFETIKATPEEKLRCVGEVVNARLRGVVVSRTATREDLMGLREWMAGHAPQSVDRLTGEMLGSAAASDGIAPSSYRRMSWSEAASFVVEFNGAGGDDGVLVAFLKSEGGRSDKKQARELAARIPDEVLRAEILKGIR
ncbi:MAG: hypothetical protein EOP87_22530 [Verrucomicrobiaceae bacterium]|nr:MAG: hypothetical protein EOP87_22530 [Verrucomicrobiaceae bacterium]